MQVLLLFSTSELGGAERSLSRMAMATNQDEIEYKLSTLGGEGPWCDWVRSEKHNPMVFGGGLTLFALCRLIKYIRRSKTEVLYVCGSRISFYLRLLKFVMPNVLLVHGVRWNPNSNSRLDLFFRFIERTTHSLVDAWITNSTVAKNTLVSRCGIPEAKIHVIYNGLESLPTKVPELKDRPMEILTVANMSPRKGYLEYLQVVQEVTKAIPTAKFVFVGRDDMNGDLQRTIKELELEEWVLCKGFQSNVSEWYVRSKLFVLPSLWNEGCPTSILEAMSYSIPCVAFSIDGIPELVENGQTGLLYDCGNYSGMSSAIIELLTNAEKSKMLGNSGFKRVSSHFSLTETSRKHLLAFEDVLQRSPNDD